MPRPWAGDRDRDRAGDSKAAGDQAGGGDPPPADDLVEQVVDPGDDPTAFPTLDPPWPDGDLPDHRWPEPGGARPEPVTGGVHIVWPDEDAELAVDGDEVDTVDALDVGDADDGAGDGEEPLLRLGPSWDEPAPCRMPRRQVRPAHRRRSRHSFEPADLSDAELDRLLRGPSAELDAGGGEEPDAVPWPVWGKVAVVVVVVVVLAGLGIVGVLEATTGDSPDTITTPEQQPEPTRPDDVPASPPPWARSASPAPSTTGGTAPTPDLPAPVPPTTGSPGEADGTGLVAPPAAAGTTSPAAPAPSAPAPASSPAPSTTVAPACHPSYDPCVPVADDVDCAGGQGNGPAYVTGPVTVVGPDDYALDADHDSLGCE